MAETTAMVLMYAMESEATIATMEASAVALNASVGSAVMSSGLAIGSFASAIGTAASVAQFAGTAMNVVGGVGQAMTASQQADLQAAQFQQQQLILSAQASNAEAQRLRMLDGTLSTQRAMFGARGVDVSGGSFQALQAETKSQSDQDAIINNLNFQQKLFQSKIGAANAALEGDAGVFAGVAKTGGALFSATTTAAKRGSVPDSSYSSTSENSKKYLASLPDPLQMY